MRFSAASSLFLLPLLARASLPYGPQRRLPDLNGIDVLDDVLVFDGLAYEDPSNVGQALVGLQAFVYLRSIDITGLISSVASALESSLGLDIGADITTATDRLQLFGAVGLPGKDVQVNIDGCSEAAVLPGTSGLPDLGLVLRNVSVGDCNGNDLIGKVQLSPLDSRNINATIFTSPSDGFGVISDIDDTVKISNVLDKLKLAEATLIDVPEPVAGMPDLYASVAKSLNTSTFIYVSGSPFQLYPFLHSFIDTTYAASTGPLLLQNFSLTDVEDLIDFASDNGILEYKLSMIDRIHGMYPGKKFLAVGDSTQKDPETYGESFRKYGDFIACSWIRQVDGANNTAERFSVAFEGVPTNRYRMYTDDEIQGLALIDVAGGAC